MHFGCVGSGQYVLIWVNLSKIFFVLHFTGSDAVLKTLTMAPHPVTQAIIDLSAGACGNILVLFISCVYINICNIWGA